MRKILLFFVLLVMHSILYANHQQAILPWPKALATSPMNDIRSKKKCEIHNFAFISKKIINQLLQKQHNQWLSNQGYYQWLENQHTLILCDDVAHRHQLFTLLQQINQQPQQIQIKAKIISVDQNYMHDLGVNFHTSNMKQAGSGSNDLSKDGIQLILTSIHAQQLLNVQLHALIENGHAKVIASPTIMTSDQIAANIESGEEVPYQQGALSGGTSIAFKKAVMQLAVTPLVLKQNQIMLKIQVHQDKVTPTTVNGVPIISTEQLQTSAILHNRATLLLGGIVEKRWSEQKQGVPILRHLPIIGFVFQRHRHDMMTKQLLVMIQPTWQAVKSSPPSS